MKPTKAPSKKKLGEKLIALGEQHARLHSQPGYMFCSCELAVQCRDLDDDLHGITRDDLRKRLNEANQKLAKIRELL